eukprot:Opistho-2@58097
MTKPARASAAKSAKRPRDDVEQIGQDADALFAEEKELQRAIAQLELEIAELEEAENTKGDAGDDGQLIAPELEVEEFAPPPFCVPIRANVLSFDFRSLAAASQFDVIMMDPPWQLAGHAPTRGVALGYNQLPDSAIEDLPVPLLQTNGFIFIWVINNRFSKALELMDKWGYTFVDSVDWIKQTVNRRMAKSHGFYLQHAKETCFIGKKGQVGSATLFTMRHRASCNMQHA